MNSLNNVPKANYSGFGGNGKTTGTFGGSGATQPSFVLGFQELQQEQDLWGEKTILIQERGRSLEGHLNHMNQSVGLSDGGEGGAAQTSLLQPPPIDAADDGRVALDPHVAGDILSDLRVAADEAGDADRHELMNGHFLRDGRV